MQCKSLRESGVLLKKFRVAYFMASTDDVKTNTEFAQANNADFAVLSDPDKQVGAAYGVLSDAGFANRWTYYIDIDGKIAYIDKKVKGLTAGQDTAARLEQLGVATVD